MKTKDWTDSATSMRMLRVKSELDRSIVSSLSFQRTTLRSKSQCSFMVSGFGDAEVKTKANVCSWSSFTSRLRHEVIKVAQHCLLLTRLQSIAIYWQNKSIEKLMNNRPFGYWKDFGMWTDVSNVSLRWSIKLNKNLQMSNIWIITQVIRYVNMRPSSHRKQKFLPTYDSWIIKIKSSPVSQ